MINGKIQKTFVYLGACILKLLDDSAYCKYRFQQCFDKEDCLQIQGVIQNFDNDNNDTILSASFNNDMLISITIKTVVYSFVCV